MKKNLIFISVLIIILSACTPITIKNVSFGWPIESVLKSDLTGQITEPRYAVSFNIKNLIKEETGSFSDFKEREIRMIRNAKGYYFVTSKLFKHVYVFNADNGSLVLKNKLAVSQTGLSNPVFNQRAPHIELIDGSEKFLLSSNKIVRK